ncbi:hypothetical protein F5Y09DRAFT_294126 [Xylaria sp. FL1042]|nr:hypothetical protein F5Y09DRAFT_294126 [Xylaria sp. FL1042]
MALIYLSVVFFFFFFSLSPPKFTPFDLLVPRLDRTEMENIWVVFRTSVYATFVGPHTDCMALRRAVTELLLNHVTSSNCRVQATVNN